MGNADPEGDHLAGLIDACWHLGRPPAPTRPARCFAEPTLHSLDAIYLATAQVLANESGAELVAFVTDDRRLLDAAKAAGLPTASLARTERGRHHTSTVRATTRPATLDAPGRPGGGRSLGRTPPPGRAGRKMAIISTHVVEIQIDQITPHSLGNLGVVGRGYTVASTAPARQPKRRRGG
ncbi:hypothetical protein ACQP0U_08770 [Micromonospora sp. CA-269861]|uniref:hypothetical protein n=1 Tax=Micromonospora sp. CA-269861 TaxID=3239968 RepID=UPI003D8F44ED